MSGHTSGGDDELRDTAAAVGDADSMSGHARGGDDLLIGGDGRADILAGDAHSMTDHAVGGDDTLDMAFPSDGASTTIAFDGRSSVTLVGVADPHALHTSDFIFA